jgi:CheY-like chemotaxis protein
MTKSGPILIIEDDMDDQDIFRLILKKINVKNELIFFNDGNAALAYLDKDKSIRPFLVLSDINLPKLSGFELRDKIYKNSELTFRCIPYLFFTTSAAQRDVINAYSRSVQGFFVKPDNIIKWEEVLTTIINYWTHCKSPNNI